MKKDFSSQCHLFPAPPCSASSVLLRLDLSREELFAICLGKKEGRKVLLVLILNELYWKTVGSFRKQRSLFCSYEYSGDEANIKYRKMKFSTIFDIFVCTLQELLHSFSTSQGTTDSSAWYVSS